MNDDLDALFGIEPGVRQYRPRGFSRKMRLPFERDVRVSGTIGLRPRTRRLTVVRRGLGLRVETRQSSFSFEVSDLPRTFRLWQEKYARIETAINAALPADRQIRFKRDAEGHFCGWGSHPVQAKGVIGPEQAPFYFRFRSNSAQLTVYPSGSDGIGGAEAVETASVGDVYPDDHYAGNFEAEVDTVRTFTALVAALAPVDVETNPTRQMLMEEYTICTQIALASVDGDGADLRKEEALLRERAEVSEVAARLYTRWLANEQVAAWIAAGRPDDGAVIVRKDPQGDLA